jgi:hypothetical protein
MTTPYCASPAARASSRNPSDQLDVLKEGAFEIVRNGVRVVSIREPGAFLGEISAVLGTVPTANVATQDSTVHVVDNASAKREEPTRAYVRDRDPVGAARLSAVTGYLVDIKRQYGQQHPSRLDGPVLSNLIQMQPAVQAGSERSDVPDY